MVESPVKKDGEPEDCSENKRSIFHPLEIELGNREIFSHLSEDLDLSSERMVMQRIFLSLVVILGERFREILSKSFTERKGKKRSLREG